MNVSHIIHDLSFGPKYPGIHNPLDETTRILHDTSGTFKYYIKVSLSSHSFSSSCPDSNLQVPTWTRLAKEDVIMKIEVHIYA